MNENISRVGHAKFPVTAHTIQRGVCMRTELNKHKYPISTKTINQRGREILVEHKYQNQNDSTYSESRNKVEENLHEIFEKYTDWRADVLD